MSTETKKTFSLTLKGDADNGSMAAIYTVTLDEFRYDVGATIPRAERDLVWALEAGQTFVDRDGDTWERIW